MGRLVGASLASTLIAGAAAGAVAPAALAQGVDPTPTPTPTPVVTPVPTAAPVAAPAPVTGAATATSSAAATLSGTVTTGGADTTYHFEYGTGVGYGLATAAVTVPAGAASPAPAVASIAGLTASTTYHYRLVATNSAGVAFGADATFTTPALPHKPAVAARTPTGIGTSSATIVGRVNPYGLATTYSFEWGTSSKVYGQSTPVASVVIGPTQTVTAELTGLQPNTRYVYRVVATNAAGTVKSSPRSVTTTRGLGTLSLKAARSTLDWDGVTVVSGVLSGTAPTGATIKLMRQRHPFTGAFTEAGSVKAGAAGTFAFSISRTYSATRLKVVTDPGTGAAPVESRVITIRTRVLARLGVTARRSTSVALRGVIYPVTADTRASLQRRSPSGKWITISRPKVKRAAGSDRGTFSVRVARSKARTQRYRLVANPNDGGAHLSKTAKSVYVPRR